MADRYAEALKIIDALAQGYDPLTGEVISDDSPLAQPPVLRALFAAREALSVASTRAARAGTLPPRAGRPWENKKTSNSLRRTVPGPKPQTYEAARANGRRDRVAPGTAGGGDRKEKVR